MNKPLRDVFDRVESWPIEAQEALRRAALAIEQGLSANNSNASDQTLLDIMQKAPLDGVEIERYSSRPRVRDVEV